ncbi:MAG: signal peptide peptidase SppA [Bacteroidetes bacterium]|nr:signal peptide peptidase SppA [Bacteroidota bacterium]
MKQFFKFFFASVLGFIIGSFLLLFVLFAIIGGIIAGSTSEVEVTVKPNSILHVNLDYDIAEKTNNNPFEDFNFSSFEPKITPGLNDIIKTIKRAKTDANIKGIYLECGMFTSGFATAEQIRSALLDFRESGKFVVSYSEVYTQKGYYVASAASKIFLNPTGLMELRGLNSQITFFKNMLDKVGVEPQVFYCGKFKSATEPFRYDKMSEPNRVMVADLIGNLNNYMMQRIADGRKLSFDEVKNVSDNMLIQASSDALNYKMVDDLYYTDQVTDYMRKQLKLGEKDKLQLMTVNKYRRTADGEKKSLDDKKIAILYAQGEIVDGKGDRSEIGSARLIEQLKKIREDEKISALVLRVNSPGGSALASDIIWREVQLVKAKKPVVVSMGDLAASGGYYISCGASKIVALPNTLTGSIGVFGILPNIQKLMNEKLGITFDGVSTGKYSDLGTLTRPVREDEKLIIQRGVDSIYLKFRTRVAQGRNMPMNLVDSIAQGRVWTGQQGLANGLVDTLGDIHTALAIAAKLAKADKYRIVEFPKSKDNGLEQIFEMLDEETNEEAHIKASLGALYPYYQQLKMLSTIKGVQARLPYELYIN